MATIKFSPSYNIVSVSYLSLLCFLLFKCGAFKSGADPRFGYTTIEHIVKRGVERVCGEKAADVLTTCKRPIVRLDEGDYSEDIHSNLARKMSEVCGKPVDCMAKRLAEEIQKDTDSVESCAVTSNGYINIRLRDEFLLSEIGMMHYDPRLGVPLMNSESVLVDYFGPNVGKELHIGHLRSAAIGQSLSNLLQFCGCRVHRRNHIGDFGFQSGAIMRYLIEYDPTTLEAITKESCDYERALESSRIGLGYSTWDLTDKAISDRIHVPDVHFGDQLIVEAIGEFYRLARDLCEKDHSFCKRAKIETVLLQNGKSCAQSQWRRIVDVCKVHYRNLLRMFRMEKIKDFPESAYRNLVSQTIDFLVEKGIATENLDHSVVVSIPRDSDSSKTGNDPENSNKKELMTLRTREGAATYLAVDIAALRHRIRSQNPDRILYVTEEAQSEHFRRVENVSRIAGILQNCDIEHIGFGPVSSKDGRKMRSKSGEREPLLSVVGEALKTTFENLAKHDKDYLNQARSVFAQRIGIGSVLYADLSTDHRRNYRFSLRRLSNQGGNTLVSILYSYVRARSIERKASSDSMVKKDGEGFRNRYERQLATQLIGLENAIFTAMYLRAPHKLCKYLFSLSKEFIQFYQHTPIISDGFVHSLSFTLTATFAKAVRLILSILNIQTVEYL